MRWLANLGWVLLGILLYFVCIDMFSGYPQYHSGLLNLLALIAVVLAGAAVWWRTSRRDEHDG